MRLMKHAHPISFSPQNDHKMKENKQLEIVEVFSRCFIIQVSEYLHNIRHTQSFTVLLDRHALQRAHQRGIQTEEIAAAIMYGYSENKQGECFYALTHRMVPEDLGWNLRRTQGLVVVCDENSGLVKTCYRRKNPVIHVRKKSKYRRTADDVILKKLRFSFRKNSIKVYELNDSIQINMMTA
jgi:hypothetical protein